MNVQILGIAQGLSFETGEAFNHLTLLLPDGARVTAAVSDEAVVKLTKLFVQSGSQAAQAAIAQASYSEVSADPTPEQPRHSSGDVVAFQTGDFSPGTIAGGSEEDDEMVSTFGGNSGDATLDAVGEQLQQAELRLARATLDSTSMSPADIRSVVEQLSTPEQIAPVPNIMKQPPAQPRRLSGTKVQADSMGNPIITGPGLVDPRALMGGDTDGEEDVGQA